MGKHSAPQQQPQDTQLAGYGYQPQPEREDWFRKDEPVQQPVQQQPPYTFESGNQEGFDLEDEEDDPSSRRWLFPGFYLAVQAVFAALMLVGVLDLGEPGGALGMGVVLATWAGVDIVLASTYAVYKFAKWS